MFDKGDAVYLDCIYFRTLKENNVKVPDRNIKTTQEKLENNKVEQDMRATSKLHKGIGL